jgi:hypothetical protein
MKNRRKWQKISNNYQCIDEPITLEPGGRVFLNEIPPDVKKKYPRMPNFSKSVLLGDDDEVDKSKTQAEGKTEEIDDTIPF